MLTRCAESSRHVGAKGVADQEEGSVPFSRWRVATCTPLPGPLRGKLADATGYPLGSRMFSGRERSPYDHLTFYLLDDKGFTVLVPPTPLRGPLAGGDDAYLAGYLAAVPGPIILVGHSYWLYPRRGRSQRSARRAAGQRWACRAHRTPYTGFAQCFALSSCRTQHLRPTRASPRERPRRRRT